jgi:hypothetical protein
MTPITIDRYKEAMREAICPMCVRFADDSDNASLCVHETSGECGLFEHLEKVAGVVSSVQSDSIEPYMEALRREVCEHCRYQAENLVCSVRDSDEPTPTWCILDAYTNLIVGVTEQVQEAYS